MISSTKITEAEFRAFLADNADDEQHYELIAGELVMSPAPQLPHQRISRKLLFLLSGLIPDGELWYAPTEVQIDNYNIYQPDLFWMSAANPAVETQQKYIGAPDLVVEILSPGTAKHDKHTKFKAYEAGGVREYWIADIANALLEIWWLKEDRYLRLGAFTDGDTFESQVLSQSVTLADIFTTSTSN